MIAFLNLKIAILLSWYNKSYRSKTFDYEERRKKKIDYERNKSS